MPETGLGRDELLRIVAALAEENAALGEDRRQACDQANTLTAGTASTALHAVEAVAEHANAFKAQWLRTAAESDNAMAALKKEVSDSCNAMASLQRRIQELTPNSSH